MSSALISAALRFGTPFLTSVSRRTAAQPAISGVAMLVPPSQKQAGSDDAPHPPAVATARERAERMKVPGATTSGVELVQPRTAAGDVGEDGQRLEAAPAPRGQGRPRPAARTSPRRGPP